jgi:hypothetical protein
MISNIRLLSIFPYDSLYTNGVLLLYINNIRDDENISTQDT